MYIPHSYIHIRLTCGWYTPATSIFIYELMWNYNTKYFNIDIPRACLIIYCRITITSYDVSSYPVIYIFSDRKMKIVETMFKTFQEHQNMSETHMTCFAQCTHIIVYLIFRFDRPSCDGIWWFLNMRYMHIYMRIYTHQIYIINIQSHATYTVM